MAEDKNDAIIRLARARMDEAYSAEQPHRERAEDDLRNVIGDQWPEEERNERESDGRPCLTINILAQNVRQVTGQIRSITRHTPAADSGRHFSRRASVAMTQPLLGRFSGNG